MVTEKGLKEIDELKREIRELQAQKQRLQAKAWAPETDRYARKAYESEINKIWTKSYNKEDKIGIIQKLGISSSELTGLKKEVKGWLSLTHGSSLGSRDRTVIGYSKVLGNYVIVNYTEWTDFMRNVRGCSSMAGTKDIRSIKIISKEQYDRIVSQEKIPTRRPTGWERRPSPQPSVLQGWY